MQLSELCQKITLNEKEILPPEHRLRSRLVCPEYSASVEEVKTYQLLGQEQIFALCWHMDISGNLYSTMYPAPKTFCYRYRFSDGERTQLHTHDYIELAYVVQGEFRQKILGKNITFSEGDLCLVDKNCLHQDYLAKGPATILFLGIANEMFSEIMNENIATQNIIAFLQSALLGQKDLQQYIHFRPTPEATDEMEECICLLLKELLEGKTGSRYIRKGLLLRIFQIMSSQYEFTLSREQRKTMNWIVFEEVAAYIRTHYEHITIRDLTEHFHFQEDYFNRLIKNKTGLTYSAYLQKIRLEKAKKLLTSTRMSVDEIAGAVGYHNKGYFYKIFQKEYGVTPSKFRKKFYDVSF